jgi:uncharacterized protein YjiS (DUF1127 family)
MHMPLAALTTQLTAVPAVDGLPESRRQHARVWRLLAPRYVTPSSWTENYLTRRRLLNCQLLDSRFAKDVGLTPAQIAAECAEPFWAAVGLSRER